VPARPRLGVVDRAVGAAVAAHDAEFAVYDLDGARRPLRQISAMPTRFACDADNAAVAAFVKPRAALAALTMRRTFGATIRIERPCNFILDEAMAEYRAAVIEDDAVGLAIGGPQNATDHLAVQTHFARRPR